MDRPKDFYRLLGVPRDASTAAIRRAYRRLAKMIGPDRAAPAGSSEALRELQLAYETLADAERRRRYDESLHQETGRLEPVEWTYFRSPAATDLRRPMRPETLTGDIVLSEAEAARGGTLPLDIPVETLCAACRGTGGASFDCDRCGGEGSVTRRLPVPLRIPPRVRTGAVFQVTVDDAPVRSVVLTVHVRPV